MYGAKKALGTTQPSLQVLKANQAPIIVAAITWSFFLLFYICGQPLRTHLDLPQPDRIFPLSVSETHQWKIP